MQTLPSSQECRRAEDSFSIIDSLVLFIEISEFCRIDEFSLISIDSTKEALAFIIGIFPVLWLPDSVKLVILNSVSVGEPLMPEVFDAALSPKIPVAVEALILGEVSDFPNSLLFNRKSVTLVPPEFVWTLFEASRVAVSGLVISGGFVVAGPDISDELGAEGLVVSG